MVTGRGRGFVDSETRETTACIEAPGDRDAWLQRWRMIAFLHGERITNWMWMGNRRGNNV